MTEKTLTTENIRPALDALRGELAPWPVVAMKQDRLNDTQKSAVNSGITSSLVAQIIANTAAIRALESAITGTGLRALVVSSLPAIGTQGILYIVPVTTYDPDTDADVVNYSNEYIWIPVEGGTDSEGHYEQVGQTGIVINNGQLNITVNGTSVGTFTANQSGDTTAAITVPTNADYVDRTTDQTIAGKKTWTAEQTFSEPIVGNLTGTASKAGADEDGTSIKTGYVNVAGNQTVTGNKEFTGSNTFNSILPNATSTYSLGSSSYQWSSVYAQSYYYNGTAWGLDKVNVWSSLNAFQKGIYLAGDGQAYVCPMWDGAQSGLALLTQLNKAVFIGAYIDDASGRKVLDTTKGNIRIYAGESNNETTAGIEPVNAVNSQLGTSTNKWKTINGINPGALSLPSYSNSAAVTIDITNVPLDGTATNITGYGSALPGWVLFWIEDVNVNDYIQIRATSYVRSPGMLIPAVLVGTKYIINGCFPIVGTDFWLNMYITATNPNIRYVRIYPCLGNA